MHQVDPRDALGQPVAEDARGPDDGLPVRRGQLAALDGLPEEVVVLDPDELRRIDRDVLVRRARGDVLVDRRDRLVHRQRVEGDPAHDRPHGAWCCQAHTLDGTSKRTLRTTRDRIVPV